MTTIGATAHELFEAMGPLLERPDTTVEEVRELVSAALEAGLTIGPRRAIAALRNACAIDELVKRDHHERRQ